MSSSFPTTYDPDHPDEAPVALPCAPRQTVRKTSPHVELQPPLSRRGHGPGLIIFLALHPCDGVQKAQTLDPEPVMKWAEEGYAVIGVRLGQPSQDEIETGIEEAIRALQECETCTKKEKIGLLVYDSDLLEHLCSYLSSRLSSKSPAFSVLVSYGDRPVSKTCQIPYVEHIFPSSSPSEAAAPPLACPEVDDNFDPYAETCRTYTYPPPAGSQNSKSRRYAILPDYGDESYDHSAAALAHTRTLQFLKPRIGGPWFDLERIWEQHTWYEFVGRSVAKTMGTMVAEPYVNHIPTMIGGVGREALTAFYRDHFIFANPPSSELQVVSRAIGIDRIVDEFVFCCNHSTEWSWFLPGIPPTYKDLRVPFSAVVCIRGDRLFHEHIAWDHASALQQVGALPSHVNIPLRDEQGRETGEVQRVRMPAVGAEGAEKLLTEKGKSNELLTEAWQEGGPRTNGKMSTGTSKPQK